MAARPDGIEVRQATIADALAILNLYKQLSAREAEFRLDADPDRLKCVWQEIEKSAQSLLVAEAEGQIVGTVTVAILPSLRRGGRPWAELENVVVLDTQRRRGVGRALVLAAEDIARGAGAYKIHLVSDFQTADAFAFYEARGYRHTSRGYKKYL